METYRRVKGERYLWLVPTSKGLGDIYLLDREDQRGFDGDTLEFAMEDKSILHWKGPWSSNPDSLYEDTGIDIRKG